MDDHGGALRLWDFLPRPQCLKPFTSNKCCKNLASNCGEVGTKTIIVVKPLMCPGVDHRACCSGKLSPSLGKAIFNTYYEFGTVLIDSRSTYSRTHTSPLLSSGKAEEMPGWGVGSTGCSCREPNRNSVPNLHVEAHKRL